MVVGTTLSHELGFDLDVLLCRKLRPRGMEEDVAVVSESGAIAFDRSAANRGSVTAESLIEDRAALLTEMTHERAAYRNHRPAARLANRSVLITDDGVISGTTMAAALNSIRRDLAFEIVVAVPAGHRGSLNALRRRCDRLVCVLEVDDLQNLKDVYSEFPAISEDESVQLYCNSATS
jgi:predicted phosphoribosyltransferase